MMKIVIVLSFVALAASQQLASRPVTRTSDPKDIQIIRSEFENLGNGAFSYRYELSDGTVVEQTGNWRATSGKNEDGSDAGIQTHQGSYQFVSDDGQTFQVSYKADEAGFQPQGAHLPVQVEPLPEVVDATAEHLRLFAEIAARDGGAAAPRAAAAHRPAAAATPAYRPAAAAPRHERAPYY